MVAAIAKWRTMTGIRRTTPGDTLEVCLEAYTDLNPAGENGIDRVEFSVSQNGDQPDVTVVSAPSLRYPNFSAVASPIPGAPSGSMAPVWGYGITLECDNLEAGSIEVSASIYSRAGTQTDMPSTIILYNDVDGGDSRPNQGLQFVDPVNGSDSNNGTLLAPKRTLRGAIHQLGGDLGGADIVLLPGTHQLCGTSVAPPFPYYTSGDWWCNVLCFEGAILTRQEPYPAFMLFPDTTPGRDFRIRFIGGTWIEDGLSLYVGATNHRCFSWIDGGFSCSELYDPAVPWTVKYANTGHITGPFGQDGSVNNHFKYVTCHTRAGTTFGFHSWYHCQDVVIRDLQGIYFGSSLANGDTICNALVERHRYAVNAVKGYIDVLCNGVATVSVPSAGVMRITATGTLHQTISGSPSGEVCTFEEQCEELVGLSNWSLRCGRDNVSESSVFDFANAGNNGVFPVIAVGTDYVELSNPSAVAEVAVSGRVRTCTSAGSLYTTVVHTDIIQTQTNRIDCLWSNIAARDVEGLRGYVDQGATMTRCALVNCHDGGQSSVNNDWAATLVDCLFLHNSLSRWTFSGSSTNRTNIVDNKCLQALGMPSGGNLYVTDNHFVQGSTVGANATTGAWYAGTPTTAPWHQTPDPSNLDTASQLLDGPDAWRWEGGTGDSRGVWAHVGTYDWSVATRGEAVEATASAAVSMSVAATAVVWSEAVAAAAVTMGVNATANVGAAPAVTARGFYEAVRARSVLKRKKPRSR